MSDSDTQFASAVSLQSRGRAVEAERILRRLVQQVHATEAEYDEWMRALAATYRSLGRQREAGQVLVYLGSFAEAHDAFLAEDARADAARARELWAQSATATASSTSGKSGGLGGPRRGAAEVRADEGGPAVAAKRFVEAAREYEAAGLTVHAAVAYATGGATGDAKRLWERVQASPRLGGLPYEQALASFNLGLVARKSGDPSAQRLLSRAQQLLENVADEFEGRGERERAFDCYAILLHLGREEGSFENLAEGYTNCIRICREDNLKFHVLQYYEDFLRVAVEREEFHAAAAIAREAADYARRIGLVYDRGYLKRSAETWWLAAEKNERDRGPVELTENAYLASIDAWATLGDFHHVRESYARLARLPLAESRRERYRRVSERYEGAPAMQGEAAQLPDYLRQQHAYPPIWEWDLVEWELDGDYAAVCASMVGDRRHASMIRRRALSILLAHLDHVRDSGGDEAARLQRVAVSLGELSAYVALRPLERLYTHPHPAVRVGVLRACKNLYFKRTFLLIHKGLVDEDGEVRDAAIEAVESVHFPHAFDPLVRIFREQPDERVKIAALTSMARTATLQAGEFLIEVLRYEPGALRDMARRLLTHFDNPEIFPILKRYVEVESGPSRADLMQVLRGAPGR